MEWCEIIYDWKIYDKIKCEVMARVRLDNCIYSDYNIKTILKFIYT
jgi:hypothetical protein